MKTYICGYCQQKLSDLNMSSHAAAHHRENEVYFANTGSWLFQGPIVLTVVNGEPGDLIEHYAKKMSTSLRGMLHQLPAGFGWDFKSKFDKEEEAVTWTIDASPKRTWSGDESMTEKEQAFWVWWEQIKDNKDLYNLRMAFDAGWEMARDSR